MATVAFTELTIRNLKPGSYFDEKTPAFGIRIGKNRPQRSRHGLSLEAGRAHPYARWPLSRPAARRGTEKALMLLGAPLEQIPVLTFANGRELFLRTHCTQNNAKGPARRLSGF